jgi:P27 family predicted phage terminase small subunit
MASLTPPKELDKIAKAAWRDLAKKHDHLVPQDAPLMRVYALAVSMLRRAEDQLEQDGLTIRTQRGCAKHPCASVAHEASQRIVRTLRELRCSPATRKTNTTNDTPRIARFEVS